MRKANRHLGSSLDDFLRQEGLTPADSRLGLLSHGNDLVKCQSTGSLAPSDFFPHT
jgi:hypothetical protein